MRAKKPEPSSFEVRLVFGLTFCYCFCYILWFPFETPRLERFLRKMRIKIIRRSIARTYLMTKKSATLIEKQLALYEEHNLIKERDFLRSMVFDARKELRGTGLDMKSEYQVACMPD